MRKRTAHLTFLSAALLAAAPARGIVYSFVGGAAEWQATNVVVRAIVGGVELEAQRGNAKIYRALELPAGPYRLSASGGDKLQVYANPGFGRPHVAELPLPTATVSTATCDFTHKGGLLILVARVAGSNGTAKVHWIELEAPEGSAGAAALRAAAAPPPPPNPAPAPVPAAASADSPAVTERVDALVDALLRRDLEGALRLVRETEADGRIAAAIPGWEELRAQAELVARYPDRMLAGFEGDAGRETDIELKSGTTRLTVERVAGGKIQASRVTRGAGGEVVGRSHIEVALSDLTPREKAKRIGASAAPDAALLRGMIALEHGAEETARQCFGQSGTRLGGLLAARMEGRDRTRKEAEAAARTAGAEHDARSAFDLLMKLAGCAGTANADAALDTVRRRRYAEADVRIVTNQLATFEARYANSAVAASNRAILAVLHEINAYCPLVVEPSAVTAAVARLKKDNPGVTNIVLQLEGDGLVFRAKDLGFRDIGGLAGIPLRSFHLDLTFVADLTPLRGMPLVSIVIRSSPVESLAPLRGMTTLRSLEMYRTSFRDATPLQGLMLTNLSVVYSTMEDLSPLAGMPLERVEINPGNARGLETWAGMGIRRLGLYGGGFNRLEILRSLPRLEDLTRGGTSPAVTSLQGLQGMRLRRLSVFETGVSDLAPLRGMELERLDVSKTDVRDLSPLAGMPLKELNISECTIADLGPLRTLPRLEKLVMRDLRSTPDASVLREIPTLNKVER